MAYPAGVLSQSLNVSLPATRSGDDENATRALDLTIALLALVFLAPLMILIAIMIAWVDPGPIIFSQQRIGRDGRYFACFKFRTMVMEAESRLQEILASDPEAYEEWQRDRKLRRDPRITRLGRFLRQTSLDELPQVFNVLRGEMSIVGPRPIVASEIPLYGRSFRNYCSVRPGITGLWQTSGRNDLPYRRRVALDVIYTRNKSLAGDLRIIVLTIPVVVSKQGCY